MMAALFGFGLISEGLTAMGNGLAIHYNSAIHKLIVSTALIGRSSQSQEPPGMGCFGAGNSDRQIAFTGNFRLLSLYFPISVFSI